VLVGAVAALVCVGGAAWAAGEAAKAPEGAPAGGTAPEGKKLEGTKAGEKPAGRPWEMPYPPQAPAKADEIYHVPTGIGLSFEKMMDVLAAARVVYVGETHDNVHAHRVELAVLRELSRRFPGGVALGMEMFREPQQEALDRWLRGGVGEIEFLKAAKWYDSWGSDFGYYRELLEFARQAGIEVVALNPPKKLEEEVSRNGVDKLPPELRPLLPEMAELDPYQRESLKAVFGAHKATEGMVDSFLRIQSLWEETMASRIVGYLSSPRGQGKRMVVVAGGWHVRYGFGIPRKVFRRLPLASATVLPTELSVPEEKQDQLMEYELPDIPLLPADFLWMVPYEDLEKDRVRLGVRLGGGEGPVKIEAVEEGFPAAKAGIEKGSEFVSLDGAPVADMADVQLAVRAKRAGDKVTLVLRKDGVEKTYVVELYRVEAPKHGDKGPPPAKDR
jgi:uncharacterized iron-regulated protein